jgi:hypothetical protein
MNVVIYSKDMEPITVIDLPMWAIEAGERRSFVAVAVMGKLDYAPPIGPEAPVSYPPLRQVTLEFVPIIMGAHRSSIIVTRDEELAMLLRPEWLPGQRGKISDYKRQTRELSMALLDVLARGVGGH